MTSPTGPSIPSSRRTFLLGGATSALALVACTDDAEKPSPTQSTEPTSGAPAEPEVVDVVVVGAGVAGLTAARSLRAAGLQVVVLEATDRVGGRLHSDRSLGVPFDIGASWIHGTDGNPVTALAEDAGALTVELDGEDVVAYDEAGTEYTDAEFAAAEDAFYDLLDAVEAESDDGISVADALDDLLPGWADDRLGRFFLSTYLTFDTGDLDALSSTLLNEGEEFGGTEVVFAEGYDIIATHLAGGLDIRTSQPVERVVDEGSRVRVVTSTGELRADHCIVTAPLGMLKTGALAFEPPLPQAKVDAIQGVGFSAVAKFLFVWDDPFWDDHEFIAYTATRPDIFNYFVNVEALHPGSAALMTFAYADEARASEDAEDAELVALVTEHLRAIYGAEVPEPHTMLRSRWVSAPFTQGAYSFTAVGTEMAHFDALAAPHGRVHFAGEHTNREYFSTVHGAHLSGLRAAEEITS